MPSTLDLCEEHFGTRDIYKLLDLEKTADSNEVKKAFYKLSLKVHPDRVPTEEKTVANIKFSTLYKIYEVLSDKQKRGLFDEQGIVDDDDYNDANFLNMWKQFFEPITDEKISNFEKSYINSETEREDIKKAYVRSKGNKDMMYELILFFKVEEEPRIEKIVQEFIDSGEVPEFTVFTKEPAVKRARRAKKELKERKMYEADKKKRDKKAAEKQDDSFESLKNQIAQRSSERFTSMISRLEDIAADEDEEDGLSLEDLGRPPKRRRTTGETKKTKKKEAVHKSKKRQRK